MTELTQRTITVNTSARAEWLVIALLIALSALPIGYGAVRLAELAEGAEITPERKHSQSGRKKEWQIVLYAFAPTQC